MSPLAASVFLFLLGLQLQVGAFKQHGQAPPDVSLAPTQATAYLCSYKAFDKLPSKSEERYKRHSSSLGKECSPASPLKRAAAGVGAGLVAPFSGLKRVGEHADYAFGFGIPLYTRTRFDKLMTTARSGDSACTGFGFHCRSKEDPDSTPCAVGQDKTECSCCYEYEAPSPA
ncbi:unnamed protein product [Vitrella brassicaformis CCMP3155]|uniref:Uncharacterized protein n=2 Tax=Vitrella brassicaformis TaxID=1169539 RepID=A0A0G4EH68_VITBC|nr:unnamed protein product [Vitrella brassicaformis CCMP3155]|eukprot:CEL95359.1 unnamed protein product [Vitrella brassicaformis CCMP3155]